MNHIQRVAYVLSQDSWCETTDKSLNMHPSTATPPLVVITLAPQKRLKIISVHSVITFSSLVTQFTIIFVKGAASVKCICTQALSSFLVDTYQCDQV